jgi:hypothetical protein
MNKLDIVKAVKNHQRSFTPTSTGCKNFETFQAIAEVIVEAENEGYITQVVTHKSQNDSESYDLVSVQGEVTPIGEELLDMDEAKGAYY